MDSIGHIIVCLVAFKNTEDVLQCLGFLAEQTYHDFEVVVCENGGPGAFAALCATLPSQLASGQAITVIADHSNPGYAGGINRCMAVRHGQAAYWVLNPDTAPRPGTLAAMAAVLAGGQGDAVGGPIVLPSGNLRTCGGSWRPWLAYSNAIGIGLPLADCPDSETVERSLSFVSGASILVSRHFIETAGPMREDYFLYGEEVEWCLRAAGKGLRLRFCRDAVVLHYQGTTTGSAEDIGLQGRLPIFCDERNRILTLRDTASPIMVAIGVIGALLLIGWRYGRRLAGRSMGNALAGWWAGVCNCRGKPDWLTAEAVKA